MKHIIRLLKITIIAFVTIIVSCQNNDMVEMTKKVKVTIKTNTVLSVFTPRHNNDFDMDEDVKIRLTVLLYDKYGMMIDKYNYVLDNYDQTCSISVDFSNNASKIVAISSNFVLDDDKSILYDAFTLSGEDNISTLEIRQGTYKGLGLLNLVGYGILDVNMEKDDAISLDLKPLTAMVYIVYNGVHSHDFDSNAIDTYGFIYHGNDIAYYSGNEFKFKTSLASSNNFGDFIDTKDYPSYDIIYSCINMLPGSFNVFGRTFVGNDKNDFSNGNISIKSGKQYTITIDCDNLSISY